MGGGGGGGGGGRYKHIKKDKNNDIYYDKTHVKFRGTKQHLKGARFPVLPEQ